MEEQKLLTKHKTDIESEEQARHNLYYAVADVVCFRVGSKGYFVNEHFKKLAANIYNMPLRSTDIFVNSYQRSGTTLVQELVWLVTNDLDYDKAADIPLVQRYPFLDGFMFFEEDQYIGTTRGDDCKSSEEQLKQLCKKLCTSASGMIATMPSPRFIKTHLPLSLLNPTLLDTVKVVYVARDPRDVAVSCIYHHTKLFKLMRFPVTLQPYFEHVKEAWDQRNHPNMLFLFYEELCKNLPASIRCVADFLGKELTQEQIDKLCNHLSIENFKNNASANFEELREHDMLAREETFIRKGEAGGWREYFDEEMTHQAKKWITDNLKDTDLRFPHM